MSDRINWDEHGIVTIDGNIVKDSNITDLICNAREKAKAVGKNQFVTSCDEHTFCTGEK